MQCINIVLAAVFSVYLFYYNTSPQSYGKYNLILYFVG